MYHGSLFKIISPLERGICDKTDAEEAGAGEAAGKAGAGEAVRARLRAIGEDCSLAVTRTFLGVRSLEVSGFTRGKVGPTSA